MASPLSVERKFLNLKPYCELYGEDKSIIVQFFTSISFEIFHISSTNVSQRPGNTDWMKCDSMDAVT